MGINKSGADRGLTVIIVPGTLAEGYGETTRPTLTDRVETRSGHRSDIERDQLARFPEMDGVDTPKPNNGEDRIEEIVKHFSDLAKKDSPEKRNWFENATVAVPASSDNISTKAKIRTALRKTRSISDAIRFLRVRANAGNDGYTVRTVHVPWASPKDKAHHNPADGKYLVGGGNTVESRAFGRRELNKEIEKCEKEQRKYIIVGHSHGGAVAIKALRNRAARGMPLHGFLGSIYIGTPVLSTRVRLFNITPINNIMSPTIGEFIGIFAIIAAALVARLVGLVMVSEGFSPTTNMALLFEWLWSEAKYSTIFAGGAVAIVAVAYVAVWLGQRLMNATAARVDHVLARKSPQYFVTSPHDEIVNIFDDLSNDLFDTTKEQIKKDTDKTYESNKNKITLGIIAWWLFGTARKFITTSFLLVFTVTLLWAFLTLGGSFGFITSVLTSLGFEPNTEEGIRQFLIDFFGDAVWLTPSTIGLTVASALFAGWSMRRKLKNIKNKLHELFERIVAIGVLGLRESKLPRANDLAKEPKNLVINKEPAEVFTMVTKLANSRGANLFSKLRDVVFDDDAGRKLRSAEMLEMLRRMPAATGLVHTSYFRSRLFMVYLAKLIAELSDGHLTFPRDNADENEKREDYVYLDEIARSARLIDLERIMMDAALTSYDVKFKNDRRIRRPDSGSWSGPEHSYQENGIT